MAVPTKKAPLFCFQSLVIMTYGGHGPIKRPEKKENLRAHFSLFLSPRGARGPTPGIIASGPKRDAIHITYRQSIRQPERKWGGGFGGHGAAALSLPGCYVEFKSCAKCGTWEKCEVVFCFVHGTIGWSSGSTGLKRRCERS